MRPPLLLAVAAALPLVPAGCVLPHTLSWTLAWSDSSLAERSVAVAVEIREGGCSGAVVWAAEIGVGDSADDPPSLGEGHYAFTARARDIACVWFAQGCREVDLPQDDADGDLRVTLSGVAEEAACDPSECIAGACGGATCDGDGCACTEGGCVQDCTRGSCSCTGGDCRVRCGAGAECGCGGGGCVMQCAPGATCECLGGLCTLACVDREDCSCQGGQCRWLE